MICTGRASTSSSVQVEDNGWWQAIRAWGVSHPEEREDWIYSHPKALEDWVVSHSVLTQNWEVPHEEAVQEAIRDWVVPHPEAIREAIRDCSVPRPEVILDWAIIGWVASHASALLDWKIDGLQDALDWSTPHSEALLEAIRNWEVPHPEGILIHGLGSDPAIRDWIILNWEVRNSEAIQDRKPIREAIRNWAGSHPEGISHQLMAIQRECEIRGLSNTMESID
jgi:hypothetical protein